MSQSPRINCPICGKRLLGERNLRMHTEAIHPQPNEDAIIAAEGTRPEHDVGHPYGLEHPVQANG